MRWRSVTGSRGGGGGEAAEGESGWEERREVMRETTEREGSREGGRRLPSEGTGTVSGLVRARILGWQWPMSMLAP